MVIVPPWRRLDNLLMGLITNQPRCFVSDLGLQMLAIGCFMIFFIVGDPKHGWFITGVPYSETQLVAVKLGETGTWDHALGTWVLPVDGSAIIGIRVRGNSQNISMTNN